jgi:hypothetical protein
MHNALTECGQRKHGNMVSKIVILTKFRFFSEAICEEKQEFREILHTL